MVFRRSRIVLIAAVSLVVLVGAGAGVYYFHFKPHPTARVSAPPVISVGSKTTGSTQVGQAPSAVFLDVVSTSPAASALGVALNAPISISFNLPVDPASAQNFISVLPAVQGTFSNGKADTDVVFTPSGTFAAGSPVNVVVRQGLTSRNGFALQNDFGFTFSTEVSDQGVSFQANNQIASLVNAQSGRPVTLTVQTGAMVPADLGLQIYRAAARDLLTSLIHSSSRQYSTNPIDTSAMHLVDTKPGVKNNDQLTLAQPDGVYLVLASDAAGQHGSVWLDFSRYGVLLRQDDQKVVVAGQDLITGDTSPTFTISFYNLTDRVQPVVSGTFSGVGEFPARYPVPIDVAVATTGGEELVIPMSAPTSDADIKVIADLGQQAAIFITTDRAGYQQGDTVKFYGLVRLSNDQAYTIPASTTVDVWIGQSPNRMVDQKIAVAQDGSFAGQFAVPAGVFSQDGTDAQVPLYASLQSSQPNDYSPFNTVLQALGPHSPAGKITVTFDKAAYVASDSVAASIAATDTNGRPLAGKSLSLNIYSTQHPAAPHEMDQFPAPTTWGVAVKQNVQVTLDAAGHATYTVSANVAQVSADQQLTLTATYGTGVSAILGAGSVIVSQAADDVFLLASRTVYQPGDVVNASFVVETGAGQRVPNAAMAYQLEKTDYQGTTSVTTVVASGQVKADVNGVGSVQVPYTGPVAPIALRVLGKDSAGNVFQDVKSLIITQDASTVASMGASGMLVFLSVNQDKVAYGVGDTAHFTITSKSAQNVLLSIERGRVHQYRWLALAQGTTPMTLPISPDLAPGFTMTFSYFANGLYVTEGVPVAVNNAGQLLKVAVSADRASYTAGQTAHLTITVTDAGGQPVAAKLQVNGFDAGMSTYKLVDIASVAQVFFTPAPRGTNASSSLVGLGNYGGRCGGGFNAGQPAATNPGQLAIWLTGVTTDANGNASVDVPISKSPVRLAFLATSSAALFGQAESNLAVQ